MWLVVVALIGLLLGAIILKAMCYLVDNYMEDDC